MPGEIIKHDVCIKITVCWLNYEGDVLGSGRSVLGTEGVRITDTAVTTFVLNLIYIYIYIYIYVVVVVVVVVVVC